MEGEERGSRRVESARSSERRGDIKEDRYQRFPSKMMIKINNSVLNHQHMVCLQVNSFSCPGSAKDR